MIVEIILERLVSGSVEKWELVLGLISSSILILISGSLSVIFSSKLSSISLENSIVPLVII